MLIAWMLLAAACEFGAASPGAPGDAADGLPTLAGAAQPAQQAVGPATAGVQATIAAPLATGSPAAEVPSGGTEGPSTATTTLVSPAGCMDASTGVPVLVPCRIEVRTTAPSATHGDPEPWRNVAPGQSPY
jgi:hypothetical protein